ncbi:MAG: modification methylase, partial [Chloroflexi bacterium RBG_16_57_9]
MDHPTTHLSSAIAAKPFLKWAGGKSQLLEQIIEFLPVELRSGKIRRYAEPFVGGGAVFFHIAQTYQHIKEFYFSDVNEELVLLYQTVQRGVEELIQLLARMESSYLALDIQRRKQFFYEARASFNQNRSRIDFGLFQPDWIDRAAQIIFLNRTCFNGLFRVNSKGEFNVPFGDYKNPRICDSENLLTVSQILQRAIIYCADFTDCLRFVNPETFVYFDPPYRPISKTASFNSYSKYDFNDASQARLAELCRALDKMGVKWMVSNSDPKNEISEDNFFDELYRGFEINRVSATRMINSNATKRGPI